MGRMHDFFSQRAKLGDVGHFSSSLEKVFRRFIGPILEITARPEAHGFDRLPADGPYMLVSNHSGGGGYEILVLAWLWIKQFGTQRRLTGMAHPVSFAIPGVSKLLTHLGAIPAVYALGVDALRGGVPVAVFPGGDHEAFRPVWQARKVDFNGRRGFLRMAREANVPIVPMGICGSHYTMPILWRSKLLPWFTGNRLTGIKRIPVTIVGLAGAAAILWFGWGSLGLWSVPLSLLWLGSPISVLTPILPWKIEVRIGDPIPAEVLFPSPEDDLQGAYDLVVDRIQALVAED